METKRLNLRVEIKAVDTAQRIIQGHAAAYSNTDRTGDAIQPGAFDRSLKESGGDVLVFVGHDSSKLPVGEPIEIRSDSHGLYTQTKIYETADGDALLEVAKQRLKSGRTLGMSIGYRTVKERWAGKVRQLLDVDLVEYSFLASPALAANPQATVVGTKARQAAGGTSTVEASYEDLQGDLREAAREALNGLYVTIAATYTDHVVVRCESVYGSDGPLAPADDDEESAYWDFPYTLGDDGEPILGEPKPVQPAFVPGAAKARAQEDHRPMPPDQWTNKYIGDLPDDSFAFIESDGGTKDDGGKTTPRSKRHFPHHDVDGKIDHAQLRREIDHAGRSAHGAKALAHLERHAKAAGIGERGDGGKADDAHAVEWAEGAAPSILLVALKLYDLAEAIAEDRTAMERLGLDTKDGARLNATQREKIQDLYKALGGIIDWAESIERGEDGKLRVDMFRHRLAMLQLEEVS